MKAVVKGILIVSLLLNNVGMNAIQNPLKKVGEWGTELQGYPAKMKAWAKKVWLCRPTNPASWCTKEEVAKSRKILGGALTVAMVAALAAIGVTGYAIKEEIQRSNQLKAEEEAMRARKDDAAFALIGDRQLLQHLPQDDPRYAEVLKSIAASEEVLAESNDK